MIMHAVHNHAMAAKPARHHRIRELLTRSRIDSQDRLQALLRADGIEVTQATLSRDLHQLGVLKGPEGYVLNGAPVDPHAHAPELRRAMAALAISVRHGGTTVVIKTGPGEASALALALDRSELAGVLGTVAGDDTVFIAAATAQDAAKLNRELSKLAQP